MSIDGRLRTELDRDASRVDVDVDRVLDTTISRGRRAVRIRRVSRIVLVAAIAVMIALAGPAVVDVLRDQQRSHDREPASRSPVAGSLVGTYATTIRAVDVIGGGTQRFQGLWQLTVRGDGLITVVPPPGAQVATLRSEYQLDGDRLLTTAFTSETCSGVGVYRISRQASTLSLTVVSDACELRTTVFASHPWTAR
jgi:hypothetical protein